MPLPVLAAIARVASAAKGAGKGLFEYLRPAWQERPRPDVDLETVAEESASWGAHAPHGRLCLAR